MRRDSSSIWLQPAGVRRTMRERLSAGSGERSIQPRSARWATWRLVTDMSTTSSSASLLMRMSPWRPSSVSTAVEPLGQSDGRIRPSSLFTAPKALN